MHNWSLLFSLFNETLPKVFGIGHVSFWLKNEVRVYSAVSILLMESKIETSYWYSFFQHVTRKSHYVGGKNEKRASEKHWLLARRKLIGWYVGQLLVYIKNSIYAFSIEKYGPHTVF